MCRVQSTWVQLHVPCSSLITAIRFFSFSLRTLEVSLAPRPLTHPRIQFDSTAKNTEGEGKGHPPFTRTWPSHGRDPGSSPGEGTIFFHVLFLFFYLVFLLIPRGKEFGYKRKSGGFGSDGHQKTRVCMWDVWRLSRYFAVLRCFAL